jgi:hypothetical protein
VLIAAVAVATMALPCFAGEVAVLKNGFSIKHERREVIGDITRLYVSKDGSSFVDVPTEQIEHFEAAPEELASGSGLTSSAEKSPLLAKPARSGAPGLNGAPAFSASAPSANPGRNLDDVVNEASGRYQLDPDLVNSVIKAESGFNARAVSPKGARGLMQLMPGTATEMGVPNAFDPQANVEGGTKYLRELLEKYNFDLVKALAAYNAGPQRVEQFGGVPPYYETRAYVARIVKDFNKKKIAQRTAAQKSASNKSAKNVKSAVGHPASGANLQAKSQSAP